VGGRRELNTILIGSEDPKRLIDYYTRLFMHPTMSDGDYTGWRIGPGFVEIGPHSDVHGKHDAPGHSAMRRELAQERGYRDSEAFTTFRPRS
jgi:hypothetical protein